MSALKKNAKTPGDQAKTSGSQPKTPGNQAKAPEKKARTPRKQPKAPKEHARTPGEKANTRLSKDHLKRVRAICLALPEATEKIAWGAPTFRVRDKIFAMYLENHHHDGRIALWCNAPKGAQEVLVGSEPKRFFKPPYVGTRGWIGLHLQANSDAEIAGFVREAYTMTAPNKLRALLGE